MNPTEKTDHFGFPSSMVSPAMKGEDWCKRYLKAFHAEYTSGGGRILRYAMNDYQKYRKYAEGRQEIDQYKEMLGTKKRKGKQLLSWRNLDWNILPILPTLINVVKYKCLGQQKDIIIEAIDPISQNEERTRRNKILSYMSNQPLIQRAQAELGTETENPMDTMNGMPMPTNADELELMLQMFPKDRYVMEMYDQIENVKNYNSWDQIWDDVIDDLCKVGVGGTKAYLDVTGQIRVRRVIPDRLITNYIIKPDFSDMTRVGEYIEMTISDLRASVPRGTFTEEDYLKMASKATGRTYDVRGMDNYFRDNMSYPYDNDKILVLDAEWFSSDDYAYVVDKSQRGNMNIENKKDPYWLDRVEWTDGNGQPRLGITDKQFADYHQLKGKERVIIRDSVKNLYGGCLVVGTDYVYNWGLKTNMQRSLNQLGECRSNYNLYTFFDSFIRKAEPLADDIQRNWLHYQNMQNQAKPNGLKINKRALTTLSVAGKGGMELDELDMLQMYAESGTFVYKGEDAAGRPYPFDPIQELKGGINEAAAAYWEFIRADIDLLRTVFGLNEATDSSTPNPKLGKAIAEMLEQNTNTALGQVYHAYSKLYEETVKSIALLVPDAEMIKTMSKDEALGEASGQFFRANSDMTFREFGIKIEDGPTNEARQRLQKYVELSIQEGSLRADDGYLIEKETNLMRAYHLLTLKRRQKLMEDSAQQQQVFEIENQKNIASAQATAEAKKMADLEVLAAEAQLKEREHQMKMAEISAQFTGQALLERMKIQGQLSAEEQQAVVKLQETFLKTQSQERIAARQAETQQQIAEENRKAAAKRPAAKK